MKLNHLHINVPNIKEACNFYTEFFGFKFLSSHGKGAFLEDEAGFLLAIDPLEDDEKVAFPSWFHFGFCLETPEDVKNLYEKMKLSGVTFARELMEFEDFAVNFYCWAPGNYKLEISWNKED